ncbi:2-phospho-L-lactate guanylyltransferase [soil metagenome]
MLLDWTVVIPVKGTPAAKSRLAGGVDLALAIALDTVEAARDVARVLVVTDVAVASRFEQLGVAVIADPGGGLSAAVSAGIAAVDADAEAAGPGPGAVAVMLGDLPALTASELRAALTAAEGWPLAMVADAESEGTTLIAALASAHHAPAFGVASRTAHLAAGYQELPIGIGSGLRHDVDTAEQLAALTGRLGPRTTAALAT